MFALPLKQEDYWALTLYLIKHSYYFNVEEIMHKRVNLLTEDGGYTVTFKLQEIPPVLILCQCLHMTEDYAKLLQGEKEGARGVPPNLKRMTW